MENGDSPPTSAAVASTLRRFNRSYTQRIGVLDDSFLATGRPLGVARLLFEIGPDGTTVLDLRRRLDLDSGYLSRMLRRLTGDELVTVVADPHDARRRRVTLTKAGRRAWRDLDRRSDELAHHLVAPLSHRQRNELDGALRTAERLLRAATVTFEVVDPGSDEAIDAMTAYFDELDATFPDGFDPGDTLVVDAPAMRAPTGAFVVARSDAEIVACGGVLHLDGQTGEIKRMWVDREWRGLGVGRRMLDELELTVQTLGYRSVVLDTNATLSAAITMYERAGYRPTGRYNDNPYAQRWFRKALAGPSAR